MENGASIGILDQENLEGNSYESGAQLLNIILHGHPEASLTVSPLVGEVNLPAASKLTPGGEAVSRRIFLDGTVVVERIKENPGEKYPSKRFSRTITSYKNGQSVEIKYNTGK